jgi:hypothetical protein
MPAVKVMLVKGGEKTYQNSRAQIDSRRTLTIRRDDALIAQFLAEHYQYWELEEVADIQRNIKKSRTPRK